MLELNKKQLNSGWKTELDFLKEEQGQAELKKHSNVFISMCTKSDSKKQIISTTTTPECSDYKPICCIRQKHFISGTSIHSGVFGFLPVKLSFKSLFHLGIILFNFILFTFMIMLFFYCVSRSHWASLLISCCFVNWTKKIFRNENQHNLLLKQKEPAQSKRASNAL